MDSKVQEKDDLRDILNDPRSQDCLVAQATEEALLELSIRAAAGRAPVLVRTTYDGFKN